MRKLLLVISMLASLTLAGQHHSRSWIFFATNEFQLNEAGRKQLDSLASSIQSKDCQLLLSGHTDSVGTSESNITLSNNRVTTVSQYLQSKGVTGNRILTRYYGESNPLFPASTESESGKNRCVEIIVSFGNGQRQAGAIDSSAVADSLMQPTTLFEHDTVFYFPNGTIIEVDASTFYPHRIRDIQFNVKEIYSLCDMLSNNTTIETENGDCLTSAGMLYINPTIDGVEIQPNEGKMVKIKIPMQNGNYDDKMTLFGGILNKQGKMVWKELKSVVSYEDYGVKYYYFRVDSLCPFNLDKRIGVICKKTGPKIKLPKVQSARLCQTYPGEKYLSVAAPVSRRKYRLDEVIMEKQPYLTIVVTDEHGTFYMAKGPLSELNYNKRSDTYVVDEHLFFPVKKPVTGKEIDEYMCDYLGDYSR